MNLLIPDSCFPDSCLVILFHKTGTCMLILTSTEVDTTGASYYGEQALHFVSVKGDAILVPFGMIFVYQTYYLRHVTSLET